MNYTPFLIIQLGSRWIETLIEPEDTVGLRDPLDVVTTVRVVDHIAGLQARLTLSCRLETEEGARKQLPTAEVLNAVTEDDAGAVGVQVCGGRVAGSRP